MRIRTLLLRGTIIFSLITIITGVLFTIDTLKKIDVSKLTLKQEDFQRKDIIVFESDSLISIDQFKTFLNFSNNEYVDETYFEKLIQDGKIEKLSSKRALVKENIEIESSVINNCKLIYCFQKSIPFYDIPKQFWLALIGIEDIRFLDHKGVDPKSIARAIVTDLKHMKFVEGGSTITQQLVKNIFLDSQKSLVRKLREIVASIYIEYKLEKFQILQAYLNEVYWGSLNNIRIKGIYAASIYYFSKKPENLSSYEATILISMLKGPGYYHPIKRQEKLKQRTNVLYKKLTAKNIFDKDLESWSDQKWEDWKRRLEESNKKRLLYSFWESQNYKGLLNDFESFVLISNIQQTLAFARERSKVKNFGVKAFFSDIASDEHFFYYSKFERDQERAYKEEKHQVGSSVKPIAYSLLLNHGRSKDDLIETSKITLDLKSGAWSPQEAHSISEEKISLIEALKKSYNRPLIRLANDIGFERIENDLKVYFPTMKLPLSEYPSQLLGALELSLYDYSKVYIKFVYDQCRKHFNEKENIIFELTNPLETTVKNVVDKYLAQMRFFGKTGTSNNGYDNWFVSFDGKWLGVIWFGYEGDRDKKDLRIFGSTTSFRIFQGFMRDRGKRFNEMTCDFVKI